MFYVFPRAVKPEVCDQIVTDCKKNILKKASVLNFDKTGRDNPEIRKTSIHFITEKDNKINELAWHFLREANKKQFNYDLTFFQAIKLNDNFLASFFGWHQDASWIDPKNEARKLSLSLILSDPDTFEGGELQFFNGDRPMEDMGEITGKQVQQDIQAQGTIIVFDSRDWHRVTPLESGTRHSIVCWCVGGNFK